MSLGQFVYQAQKVIAGKLSKAGYFMGDAVDPDNVTPGTQLNAYVIDYIVQFSEISPTRNTAVEESGGQVHGQVDMGTSDLGTFTMEVSRYTYKLNELATGAKTNTTSWGGYAIGSPNYMGRQMPRMLLAFQHGQQSRDPDSYGDLGTMTYAFLNAQVNISHSGVAQGGGTNPNNITMTVKPSIATRLWNGVTLQSLDLGFEKNMVLDLSTDFPWSITTYILEGGVDPETFTLPYLPISDDATGTDTNIITINGVAAPVTSVNTSTGVVTVPSDNTAGDVLVIQYATDFTPTA